MNINKLKHGQRIQFANNSYGQITNYEIDISNLKGTVIEYKDMIGIKLDKYFSDLDDWNNELHFDISKETIKNPYEMKFGTSFEYLQKARLI